MVKSVCKMQNLFPVDGSVSIFFLFVSRLPSSNYIRYRTFVLTPSMLVVLFEIWAKFWMIWNNEIKKDISLIFSSFNYPFSLEFFNAKNVHKKTKVHSYILRITFHTFNTYRVKCSKGKDLEKFNGMEKIKKRE